MPQTKGAYLGAVRNLEGLRQTCFLDADCWHLRSSRGKPMPKDRTHTFFLHGVGKCSATRGAWFLEKGRWPRRGIYITRVCDSYDCVNPAHLKAYTRLEQGEFYRRTGKSKSSKKTIAARVTARRRSRLTDEQRKLIVESQTGSAAASLVGVSLSYAISIRRQHRDRLLRSMGLECAA